MNISRHDSMEELEKQIADLQMISTSVKTKKVPPAVPPKKKLQSQNTDNIKSNLRESSLPHTTRLTNSYYTNDSENGYSKYTTPASTSHAVDQYKPINLSSTVPSPFYANIQHNNISYDKLEDLPQVPSPPSTTYYIEKLNSEKTSKEEYFPPPSPVSSNYSELARAGANIRDKYNNYAPIYQNECINYGPTEPQTSAYESLYEPIDLQPHAYDTNKNIKSQNYIDHNIKRPSPLKKSSKEAEVDALTDLLVQSISDNQDIDFFGICIKCNQKIVGENSGCTAMGKPYHIKCFCCCQCNSNLHGKSFYAVEEQPYCENDYQETLEKCYVCQKSISDRILRATGNPYHKDCFTCVVCKRSLDGVPFTVDAMNQIHCIDDFHKKFAPRCCVCDLPIMPEEGEEETVRVVALDRSFHVKCYKCEDCSLQLSSEAEGRGCYPLDDHILCKNCNAYRICMLTNVITTDL